MDRRLILRLLITMLMLMGMTAGAMAQPMLFAPSAQWEQVPDDAARAGRDPVVMRERFVTVNFDALAGPSAPAGAAEVMLNLFDDVVVRADRKSFEPRGEEGYTWTGSIPGSFFNQATIVIHKGIMVGNVSIEDRRYQIRYSGRGNLHVIREIDQSKFPPEREPIPVELPAIEGKGTEDFLTTAADTGSTIDVMVLYTASAAAAAGGTDTMEALIELGITETNQSYQNSGITQRIALVHKGQVSYTETPPPTLPDEYGGMEADLDNLTGTSDGYMDDVHTLRNTYKADLVSLWIQSSEYCGIAWLMATVSTSFAPYGFSVVAQNCATGYDSFGHEMGHNMGANHDRYMNDPGAYEYSHGYVSPDNTWRTIMAYPNACGGCPKIQHFSNPDVLYNGAPTGVAEGQLDSADNRKTLNNTAYTVANFRQSNALPTLGTLTPSVLTSATGATRIFTAVYSHASGYAELKNAYLLINTTLNGANSIYVYYNRSANKLYLRNDGNTADVGNCTPGVAGMLTNTQGTLDCGATSVTPSGNDLTVIWNITPKAAFAGTRNLYMFVSDNAGASAGWTDKGDWTITAPNVPPTFGTLTPSVLTSSTGAARDFGAAYSDTNGYADLRSVYLLINTTLTGVNAIYVYYNRSTNKLYLRNDANTADVGSCTPGVTGTLTNAQGTLDCGATSVTPSGNSLTVNWNITPKPAFAGTRNLYMYASDMANASVGWTDKGDWTITVANFSPTLGTLSPSILTSAKGSTRNFSGVYSDANGYADLKNVYLLINATLSGANAIYVSYNRSLNKLYLRNDANTADVGSCTPGAAGMLTNTQGTLDCAATTVTPSGNDLTVKWNITPKAAFAGTRDFYMYVKDTSGAGAGWTDKGDWTITP